MKKACTIYTSEDISKFIDNELPHPLYHELEQHMNLCPECRRLAEEYKVLSAVLINHADHEILKIDSTRIKANFVHKIKEKEGLGNIFKLFGKNIYLKLTSIAAILAISLFAFQGGLFDPVGPSAIVISVDTDVASVMIIETQKGKHTIIWFSET
ncbi:anti-sigma factor family protein [Desulfobacula sp.]